MTPFTPEMILAALKSGPKTYDELAPAKRRARALSGVYSLTEAMIKSGQIEKVRAGNNQWVLTLPGFTGSLAELEFRMAPHLEIDGACLVWTGHSDPVRGPMLHWRGIAVPVRRLLWTLSGRPLKSSQTLRCRCEEHNCLRLSHLRLESRAEALIGKPLPLMHKMRIAESKRRQARFAPEVIEQVKASTLPARQIAADANMPISTVYAIKTGRLHREYRANPFSGLVPANHTMQSRA